MPAKNPRINVVLDNALYKSVSMLAEKDNLSLSAEVKICSLKPLKFTKMWLWQGSLKKGKRPGTIKLHFHMKMFGSNLCSIQ